MSVQSEPDKKRIETATLAGFEPINTDGRVDYVGTESQLIDFAKRCEAAGRAQVATALRIVVARGSASPAVSHALTIAADMAEALNKQFVDAESAKL